MRPITLATYISKCLAPMTAVMFSGCEGIFNNIYDEPDTSILSTYAGQLYIDASNWEEWHYIDFRALSDSISGNAAFNPSSLWRTYAINIPSSNKVPMPSEKAQQPGIYTYWYDVFGEGISKYEFQGFSPTEPQEEPENWTIAVHRNNVRTNGCAVAETSYSSLLEIPDGHDWISSLSFIADEWNETDVWAVQDQMLLGVIGNQGIYINNVLSRWLNMEIPPMPPSFTINRHIFVIKLPDGTIGAVQLADYMSASGTKCCLTINYKYPI